MHLTSTLDDVTPGQLHGFFEGWPNPPSSEMLHLVLKQSYRISLAVEETGRVVGIAQAISDGVLTAFIPMLEVHASYRGQGLGTELMRHLLRQLEHPYAVDLSCDDDLVPFYERLNMKKANAMVLRKYERQNGSQAEE